MKYFIYCRKSTEDDTKQIQSIEDQERILKNIAQRRGLEVIEVLKESRSAKAPGRPFFNYMIDNINKGKADGVICWKLDRLARNPVDGGTINWMLQQGIIKNIVTPDRDYLPCDNVLMMSVEFGMANQFIRDLGNNTKRGMRSKCEKGWFPGVAPLGYCNNKYCEKGTKYIIKDEQRFILVRKMWDLMLSGEYSIQKICNLVNKKWGFETPKRKKSGGNPLRVSSLYYVLTNPFYYGEFEWGGEVYKGQHEPMITKAEFDYVQKLLGERGKPRPINKIFTYTGLIQCGECGCMVTAEDKSKFIKSKKIVKKYEYYHCTHKKKEVNCKQKSIEKTKLEKQIQDFLSSVTIEDEFIDWIIKYLHEFNDQEVFDRTKIADSLQSKLNNCTKRMDNLIKLKIEGDLLTNEEFKNQKKELVKEKEIALRELEHLNDRQNSWVDSAEKAVHFLRDIKTRFNTGTIEEKRLILSTLGSNLTLKDGELSIEATNIYTPIQKGILETKEYTKRLEPQKRGLLKRKRLDDEALYSIWLPRLDSNQ